jgi:uncharacterized protein YbjT (DUF2867 family)
MILVTTAGKVGTAAAQALAADGVPVRVVARDPDKVRALAQAGVEIVQGDLEVRADVDRATRGVTSVVLVSPPVVAQELAVIESAKAAGVEHVVKITSKASSDAPIRRRRDQAAIEDALIASGLGYTLLRNNAYMQNFLMMAPLIAATDGFASAAGDGRIGHLDARDAGAVAARIAAAPDVHRGATYWPTGPESLSGREAATVLSEALGRPIAFTPISRDEQKQAMLAAGLPEPVAEDNTRAVALMADGDCDYVTDDVPAILGRPARSLLQFATELAAAFTPAQARA